MNTIEYLFFEIDFPSSIRYHLQNSPLVSKSQIINADSSTVSVTLAFFSENAKHAQLCSSLHQNDPRRKPNCVCHLTILWKRCWDGPGQRRWPIGADTIPSPGVGAGNWQCDQAARGDHERVQDFPAEMVTFPDVHGCAARKWAGSNRRRRMAERRPAGCGSWLVFLYMIIICPVCRQF